VINWNVLNLERADTIGRNPGIVELDPLNPFPNDIGHS
jgi:hypothetical protein